MDDSCYLWFTSPFKMKMKIELARPEYKNLTCYSANYMSRVFHLIAWHKITNSDWAHFLLLSNIEYLLKYSQRSHGCLPHNKTEELVWDANINIWSGESEQNKKVEMANLMSQSLTIPYWRPVNTSTGLKPISSLNVARKEKPRWQQSQFS